MHAIGAGERAAVDRIRHLLPAAPAGEVWIGDDAAVVRPPDDCLLLATDLVVDNVHFDLSVEALDDVGWAALARSLSDVAAMGGRPRHALVAVAGPASTDLELLYRGLADCASTFGCPVVGGDLSTAGVLSLAVTVTGTVAGGQPVLRSGARAGDAIFVTGALGAAAAARRAGAPRRPRPRLDEGEAARRAGATAMIDVSDGLAIDLVRLAEASGVGFTLDDVPVAAGATRDDALGGGDDYELLFCLPAAVRSSRPHNSPDSPHNSPDSSHSSPRSSPPAPGICIGRCTDDPGERTLAGRPLPAVGWEHPWS